jgi:hypothetical protein
MSNATASVSSVSSVSLVGKSAKEMRELLASGATTSAAVIAHLSAKATLRDQSQRLLNELLGVKPAKAAKKASAAKVEVAPAPTPVPVPAPAPAPAPAPEAKVEKKAPRVSNEAILAAIEGLASRMDALEVKVDRFASFLATVEAAKAAPVEPVRTGEILIPVVEELPPVVEEEVAGDDAPLSWAEAKARYATESVANLREMLKGLDLPTNGKKEALIERLLTCYVELELVLPAPVAATAKTTSVVAEF